LEADGAPGLTRVRVSRRSRGGRAGRRGGGEDIAADPIPPTIEWRGRAVRLIDQRRLPEELVMLDCRSVDELCAAITDLAVRGAPALGAAGAMGVARAAHESGRRPSVWVDETRPVLQGSRLTAWELQRLGIPCTVVADVMAGSLMAGGEVDAVVVGADRIAANGDVANKIGTYP